MYTLLNKLHHSEASEEVGQLMDVVCQQTHAQNETRLWKLELIHCKTYTSNVKRMDKQVTTILGFKSSAMIVGHHRYILFLNIILF